MADQTAHDVSEGFTPLYGRSWVDRLFDWIEGLPFPVWAFHTGFFVVVIVVGFWFNAPNYPAIPGWMFTTISAFILSGTHWLRRVSQRAVGRIRPALDLDDPGTAALAHRLTYMPPRTAWILLAFEAVYLPIYVMSSAEPFGYRELSPRILIPGLIVWGVGEAIGYVLIVMTIRRLIIIGRVHRDLARVELFRQQPLHAFSAVTMRSALVMLFLFGYVPLLTLGTEAFGDPLYLGSLVVGAFGAVVVAVVPLVGTHSRIVEERRARAMATGHRIQVTLDAMADAVDGDDTPAIERSQKALTALISERDLVDKAPTWPWTPGTVRTLVTTLVLPIFFLLASRIADRWFG